MGGNANNCALFYCVGSIERMAPRKIAVRKPILIERDHALLAIEVPAGRAGEASFRLDENHPIGGVCTVQRRSGWSSDDFDRFNLLWDDVVESTTDDLIVGPRRRFGR